jgi:hypothetical protein
VIVEEAIDSQHYRCRKLTEALVELILFSTTDEELYFQDYWAIRELNDYVDGQRDRAEFYGKPNRNYNESISFFFEVICGLETRGVEPSRRWYLARPEAAQQVWRTEGARLSSFRRRYKATIQVCDENELVCIGKSYIHAYGTSRDVHFTPHDTSSSFSEEDIVRGVDRCALLTLTLLARCVKMLGLSEDSSFQSILQLTSANDETKRLVREISEPKAEVGDYVLVYGDLARVVDRFKSAHGFHSYEVEYLDPAPISVIKRDWFAAFEIHVLQKKKPVADLVEKELQRLGTKAQTITNEMIQYWMDESARRIWFTIKADRLKHIGDPVNAKNDLRPEPPQAEQTRS